MLMTPNTLFTALGSAINVRAIYEYIATCLLVKQS